ncbi:MAG: N-acetyltransferase [Thermoanaerobaculia bacterium]|nr:N-acetyltransferase [Thermoanaerobaculia bacterium]
MPLSIRNEEPSDRAAVESLLREAFGGPAEARIVRRLRREARPLVSLVAVERGAPVGHILFSPVSIAGRGRGARFLGLGPMAVPPARQRRGIGSRLVREGLEACRELGCEAVVLVGHPEYYPRFGFVPASRFGLTWLPGVPDEAFLALELAPGALAGGGRVEYHPVFAEEADG